MHKIGGYIGRSVFGAILLVLFLVIVLDAIAAIIDQLGDLRGDYTFYQSLLYVLLTIPGSVYDYMPLSALVGCMIAMGSLSSSSELTVLRVSGVSVSRLVWFACKPALWLIVFSVLVSEYVSPYTERWAQSHKGILMWGDERTLASRGGLWHREGNTFMHFNVVQAGGILHGVTLFEFDDHGAMKQSTFASRASYLSGNWLLERGSITIFLNNSISSKPFHTKKWEPELTPKLLRYLAVEAEDLSLTGLFEYARYLEQQELDDGAYRLAFWQKCFHPLAVFSLVLIALSFVFGPLRTATMGFRVFIGVVIGIAFQFAQNLLGPSSLIYGFPPIYGVLLPILICGLVGFTLLYRAR